VKEVASAKSTLPILHARRAVCEPYSSVFAFTRGRPFYFEQQVKLAAPFTHLAHNLFKCGLRYWQ
jgi:hypothetical protein